MSAETARPVMRTPRWVNIEITSRCNLRCRYCSFFDKAETPTSDLPTAEWLAFFEELGSLGVMAVILSGGEPFSRRDLPELLEGIVRNRMRFAILSNGALIKDDVAAFIAATGRCDYVQVSVDGSRAEIHDIGRGKGAFEGAIRGLRSLVANNVEALSRITIHKHNIDDLEATAELLLDELGLASVGTNSASYLGSCRGEAENLMLSPSERQRAMETMVRLRRRWPGRFRSTAGPDADLEMWGAMLAARAQGGEGWSHGGHLTACGCPSAEIAVRSDGAVVPCNLLNHLEMGRINRDPLRTIWTSHPQMKRLRERKSIPLGRFAFCEGCGFSPYCTGNCPALAVSLVGEIDHPSPDGCLRRYLAAGGTVPTLE